MTHHNAPDLINADGSFNTALIMRIAHRKARAEINLHICICAQPKGKAFWRSRDLTRWVSEDAAFAATVAPAQLAVFKAQRSFPNYAALVKAALKEVWFAARVTRQRWNEAAARSVAALPAPMFLMAAE